MIVFADPGGPEVIAISLWSSREDADTHARGAYMGLVGRLATLIERAPSARTARERESSQLRVWPSAFFSPRARSSVFPTPQ
jgi:hypothetical protein